MSYALPSLSELDIYYEQCGLSQVIAEIVASQSQSEDAIEPEPRDLARLHHLVRTRRCLTTLEFGVGYSTIAIAHAVSCNKADFKASGTAVKLRNSRLFEHHVVDANTRWLEHSKALLPASLVPIVTYHQSDVHIGQHRGQLCHYYSQLPNVIPDFIYLDGPDPADVQGSINGLDFSIQERTVMAADLLLMESCFLPGTIVLVDGRTNNARFLARNFTRNFEIVWDRQADVTVIELDEERLGPHNILGSDLF